MVDPIKLSFRPGINREVTEYSNTGGYVDGNLVRFVKGFPQSVGGWTRLTSAPTVGVPRGLFPFVLLDGTQLYTTGSEEKYYTVNGTELIDITPLRQTQALVNPFTTTNTSTTAEPNGMVAGISRWNMWPPACVSTVAASIVVWGSGLVAMRSEESSPFL